MAEPSGRKGAGGVSWFIAAIVVAGIVGAGAGYFAGTLSQPGKPAYVPSVRTFWVFTVVLPINETTTGVPHDAFAPDRIVVYKGDNVTIHFFNTEEEPEDHTFTMDAPYAMDHVVPYNTTVTFSFTASVAGIFPYRCTYHQPTMTGYLIVLEP